MLMERFFSPTSWRIPWELCVCVRREVYKYKEYCFGTTFNKINLWRRSFLSFPFLSIIFPFSGNCCWSPNPLVVAHLEVCFRHDPAHLAPADETSYGHLERQSINNKHNK